MRKVTVATRARSLTLCLLFDCIFWGWVVSDATVGSHGLG